MIEELKEKEIQLKEPREENFEEKNRIEKKNKIDMRLSIFHEDFDNLKEENRKLQEP